jgi:hypothetical protein
MSEEPTAAKNGARVYFHNDGVVQVVQTILRNGRYVLETKADGKFREAFINPKDDQALVEAIRAAGKGNL